jgi:hypothetical protein
MASRSVQITQDTFNNNPISISRCMHKLINLIHYITYISPCGSKILESTNNLSVACRVRVQDTKQHDEL